MRGSGRQTQYQARGDTDHGPPRLGMQSNAVQLHASTANCAAITWALISSSRKSWACKQETGSHTVGLLIGRAHGPHACSILAPSCLLPHAWAGTGQGNNSSERARKQASPGSRPFDLSASGRHTHKASQPLSSCDQISWISHLEVVRLVGQRVARLQLVHVQLLRAGRGGRKAGGQTWSAARMQGEPATSSC